MKAAGKWSFSLKSVGWQSQAEGSADSGERRPAGRADAPGNPCGQSQPPVFMATLRQLEKQGPGIEPGKQILEERQLKNNPLPLGSLPRIIHTREDPKTGIYKKLFLHV